jgi:hypothetical protein
MGSRLIIGLVHRWTLPCLLLLFVGFIKKQPMIETVIKIGFVQNLLQIKARIQIHFFLKQKTKMQAIMLMYLW